MVIFDIDETTLSNLDEIKAEGFGKLKYLAPLHAVKVRQPAVLQGSFPEIHPPLPIEAFVMEGKKKKCLANNQLS